jgi:hypothetical protein
MKRACGVNEVPTTRKLGLTCKGIPKYIMTKGLSKKTFKVTAVMLDGFSEMSMMMKQAIIFFFFFLFQNISALLVSKRRTFCL